MKVLAIGAHPDDIELGAAGALARHVQEQEKVYFLILSYGERSGDRVDRMNEALASSKVLGVKEVKFLGIPDAQITDGIDTILGIENVINEIEPQRVYIHCTKDAHQDHRNAAFASVSAARNVHEIFSYESPLTHPNFSPQYFVEITDTMPLKIEALKNFNSQGGKDYTKAEAVEGLAKFRGLQVGVHYAEAFEVVRLVKRYGQK
jgi:LmbE family N-acetylglucosaminyl deacetylase